MNNAFARTVEDTLRSLDDNSEAYTVYFDGEERAVLSHDYGVIQFDDSTIINTCMIDKIRIISL